jgi:hypothetical protein
VGYQSAVLVERDGEHGVETDLYTWGCSDDGFLGRVVAQDMPDKERDESTPQRVAVDGLVAISGTIESCGFIRFYLVEWMAFGLGCFCVYLSSHS